jgi:hypothetical protein
MEPDSIPAAAWPDPNQPQADSYAPPAAGYAPPVAGENFHAVPLSMEARPGPGMGTVTGLQMKQRSPIGVWLLGIVTFGIYPLVYWYKVHAELGQFDPRREVSPVFELMSVWLLGFTIVLPILSIVHLAERIRNAQTAVGLSEDCSGGLGILFAILSGTHVIYYQSKLNQVIAANSTVPAGQPVTLRA